MSVESIARVLNNSRAKGTTKLVLVGIANHDGDGGAWPSIATLQRYANADRRTVQRAIRDLVALGEVVVHDQDGGTRSTREDRRPNRYTITVTPREDGTDNGAASVPPRDVDGAAPVTERGGTCDANGAAPAPPEPSFNHPEPSTTSSPATPPTDHDPGFDAFWSAYPRKIGKGQARRAWAAAVKKTDAEAIIAAARRFAGGTRELRFCPYPATWLNGERWADEVEAADTATTTARVSQAMDVARRMAEADGQTYPDNVRAIGGRR